MREILFRGKRVDTDEWVEGIYSPYTWDFFGNRKENPNIIVISNNNAIDGLWTEVVLETVGQYTGLTDKNGKKIFEGDIAKFVAYEIDYSGIVKIVDGNACIVCCNATPFLDYAIFRYGAYVIGNIHDNPELLEVGK